MRPPQVDLPSTEQKCLPRGHCAQATTCARWLVVLTPGRLVDDMSLSPKFVQGKCPQHLDPRDFHKAAPAPVPTVHDTPAGLA